MDTKTTLRRKALRMAVVTKVFQPRGIPKQDDDPEQSEEPPPPPQPKENRLLVFKKMGKKLGRMALLGESSLPPTEREEFILKHPFFDGTSRKFRRDVAKHLQTFENWRTLLHIATDKESQKNESMELFLPMEGKEAPVSLLLEGVAVPAHRQGLFLTSKEDNAVLETSYTRLGLGDLTKLLAESAPLLPCVAGQEVALGVTTQPLFTSNVMLQASKGLFFIPLEGLNSALHKFENDRALLQHRAYSFACGFLQTWFRKNAAMRALKLFSNTPTKFKHALMECMRVRVCKAGSTICTEGENGDTLFHIFSGEAEVIKDEEQLCRLSKADGTRAWESWWGMIESGGTSFDRTATVKATTDCVILEWTSADLEELRALYPQECSLLDHVATIHLKILSPHGPSLLSMHIPTFADSGLGFMKMLVRKFTERFVSRNVDVLREGDIGDEMMVLMRGSCTVTRGGEHLSTLHPGATTGGLAVLNVSRTRTATVTTRCACELRVLKREPLLEVLELYPEEQDKLRQQVEVYSHTRKNACGAIAQASASQGGFSEDFVNYLVDNMRTQLFLANQMILEEEKRAQAFLVLVVGVADIEHKGVPITRVSAPAIFGERGLLSTVNTSNATVRSAGLSECMVLTLSSPAVPTILKQFPDDITKLSKMLESKYAMTRRKLDVKTDLSNAMQSGSTMFFRDCSPAFISRVSVYFEKAVYLEGQALFTQGHESANGVIVQKGTAQVEIDGSPVAKIMPGEFLGEFVVLGVTSKATATVRALGTMVTFHIDRHAFKELLDEFPKEKQRLENMMKRRLEMVENPHQNGRSAAKLIFNSRAVAKLLLLSGKKTFTEEADEAQPKAPKTMKPAGMPGRRKLLGDWVSQRKQQLISAPSVKLQRMLDSRKVVERLPPDQGLRVTRAGFGTPWAAPGGPLAPLPSEMRLLKTAGVYGRKVWQESFTPRPAPPAVLADAEELEEALDELEDGHVDGSQYSEEAFSEGIESELASLPDEEDSNPEGDDDEEESTFVSPPRLSENTMRHLTADHRSTAT